MKTAIMAMLLFLLAGCSSEPTMVKTGIYDHVEYQPARSILEYDIIIIHFDDGSMYSTRKGINSNMYEGLCSEYNTGDSIVILQRSGIGYTTTQIGKAGR